MAAWLWSNQTGKKEQGARATTHAMLNLRQLACIKEESEGKGKGKYYLHMLALVILGFFFARITMC